MKRRKNENDSEYAFRCHLKYLERRRRGIEYLGSKCVDCGSTDKLEFDHRVRSEKTLSIGKIISSFSWDKIVLELDKCVLRCVACHYHKTAYENLSNVNVLDKIL